MKDSLKLPKICQYTKAELDYLIASCNFTEDELNYFKLKAKDKTNLAISHELIMSDANVSRVAREVRLKIQRVVSYNQEFSDRFNTKS